MWGLGALLIPLLVALAGFIPYCIWMLRRRWLDLTDEFEGAKHRNEKDESTIKELENEKQSLTTDVTNAKVQLEKEKKRCTDRERERAHWHTQYQDLEQLLLPILDSCTLSKDQLEERLARAAECEQYKKQAANLEQRVAEGQKILADKESDLKQACKKRDESCKLLDQEKAGKEKLEDEIQALQKALDVQRDACTRKREELVSKHQQEIDSTRKQAAQKIKQLRAAHKHRKQEAMDELQGLKNSFWPRVFLERGPSGLRNALQENITAASPLPASMDLFGALHSLAASIGTRNCVGCCYDVGRAFYSWMDASGVSSDGLEFALAEWLTQCLETDRFRVEVVAPEADFVDRYHSREGQGSRVKKVQSFLILRHDGTTFKKALVIT